MPKRVRRTESRADRKKRLLSEGRWGAFLKRREELRAEGKTPEEEEAIIVFEFGPGTIPEGSGEPEKQPANVKEILAEARSGGNRAKEPAVISEQELSLIQEGVTEIDGILDRVTNIDHIIFWVSENIEIPDIPLSKCPSRTAYNLYLFYRKNDANKHFFWQNIFPKYAPKPTGKDDSNQFRDDKRQYFELCDKFEAFAGSPVLPPGSEGSDTERTV